MARPRGNAEVLNEFRRRRARWLLYSCLFSVALLVFAGVMREMTPALAVLALGAALMTPGLLRDFLFLMSGPGCNAAVYPRWLWAKQDPLLPSKCPHCGLRLR